MREREYDCQPSEGTWQRIPLGWGAHSIREHRGYWLSRYWLCLGIEVRRVEYTAYAADGKIIGKRLYSESQIIRY